MKNARHEEILNLVASEAIETQEELAEKLLLRGFNVTQATVSRDIRQLQLRKIQGPDGRLRYTAGGSDMADLSEKYRRVLRDAYISSDSSLNILVIHTVSGMAMAAGAALDSLGWEELLGCIAGDDTLMAVMRSPEDAPVLTERLESIRRRTEDHA